jgi:hypothetical protein
MRRIPIQIDDKTYDSLRKRSFDEKRSIASIVRECLEKSNVTRELSLSDFSFVGSGRSKQGALAPVSRNHDAALAEALAPKRRRG